MSSLEGFRKYAILSVVGAMLLGVTLLLGRELPRELDIEGMWVVGIVFIAACAIGASLAVRPNWPSRLGLSRDRGLPQPAGLEGFKGPRNRGHHPPCGEFRGHRIHLRGRALCAGCTGLLLGGVVAIVLMAAYLLRVPTVVGWPWYDLYLVGYLVVLLSFLETWYPSSRRRSRSHGSAGGWAFFTTPFARLWSMHLARRGVSRLP